MRGLTPVCVPRKVRNERPDPSLDDMGVDREQFLLCLFNRLNRTTIENQSGIKLTGHCTDALFGMQG